MCLLVISAQTHCSCCNSSTEQKPPDLELPNNTQPAMTSRVRKKGWGTTEDEKQQRLRGKGVTKDKEQNKNCQNENENSR